VAKVKEDARGIVITLSGSILFRTDQSTLLPIARVHLDRVAEALREVGEAQTIVIEGHTDSRASTTYNLELSRARAETVRAHLVSRGVPADRIEAIGQGESDPVASNASAEGRANNRRVEIIVSPPT
jgi:outer membrane protein OmpA-like peptidoglycan-associated protein